MLFKIFVQLVGHNARDQRTHIRVAELCLGLALKLRVGQLDADDGAKPFKHVGLREVGVGILQKTFGARVLVHTAQQRRAEALLMRAAVDGRHVVGKGNDRRIVAVVVLHRNLGDGISLLPLHVDDVGGQRSAPGVEVFDIADDAALIAEIVLGDRVGAQVTQHDAHARVEKRLLAHAVQQNVIFELGGIGEDRGVGLEPDIDAVPPRSVLILKERTRHLAALKALGAVLCSMVVVDLQPLGQCVDNRCAHAV